MYQLEPRASTAKPPQAFSLNPSGNFDGNDGPWSTFIIRVGTPAQFFRVLPSTNSLETLIPIPDRCEQGQSWCGNARGVEPFNGAASPSPYSGSPNELFTTSLDPGKTCTANRSPMCINCISVNGKCTDGACAGRNCCGDPAGSCNGQGCNGLNGICTGPYIGCPCVGPDYNIAANSPSSAGILNAVAASGFQSNLSSTWSSLGPHRLLADDFLNTSVNGQYGTDRIGLGVEESGSLALTDALVAGITTQPFYIGTFGLKPANSTSVSKSPATFMTQLKQQNLIPSLSYSYTAGAIYRQPSVLGSLTLGGYDVSRSLSNNISLPLGGKDSVSPVVGIESITASSTLTDDVVILSNSVTAVINTALPFLYLPIPACQVFEKAFGLTWNDTKEMYLVDHDSHQNLLNKSPSITFRLGNSASGPSLNITLPYSAFNLQASNPIFPNGTNYFPLRRASDPSQYTLGRTFLQEVFMFVDYEQSKFSISQAQFPTNISPQLITVNHSPQSSSEAATHSDRPLSRGAIAGIVIGSSVAFVLLCTLAVFFFRRRRQNRNRRTEPSNPMESNPSFPGKESWPNSPDVNQIPGQSDTVDTARHPAAGEVINQNTKKPSSFVGELEDPMTAITAPSMTWPAPAPRHELHGSDTAKELPPTPTEKVTSAPMPELAHSQSPRGKRRR